MDLTGIGSVADAAKTIVNKIFPDKLSDGDRAQAELKLQEILASRDQAVLQTQGSVMVSELQQEDKFTKRGRPAIIYCGLLFIFLIHVFLPILSFLLGRPLPPVNLPEAFWGAWSGVCSLYVISRSVDKLGIGSETIRSMFGKR